MLNNKAVNKMLKQASTMQVRSIANAMQVFNIFASKRKGQQRTLTLYNTVDSSETQANKDAALLRKMLKMLNLQAGITVEDYHGDSRVIRIHCVLTKRSWFGCPED